MHHAVLRGALAFSPGSVDFSAIRRALTHKVWKPGEEEPTVVISFRESDGRLEVPRQFGLAHALERGIEVEDATSDGVPLEFLRRPTLRAEQEPVLEELTRKAGLYYDFVFRARTGFGKTVSALELAARLGRSTLVVVDQENLLAQWKEALSTHFGMQERDIGHIQGTKTELRPITLAMIQTLSRKRQPQEVYDYFGTVIVDEVHMAGAPTFSTVLMDFSATFRLGVSATPTRKDGLQKLLDHNLGKPRVYVSDQHAKSAVYIKKSQTVYSWYANSSPKAGRYLTEIAEDSARALLVAESAIELYDSGRDTLVLGDRIEHLLNLMDLCYYLGVPAEDMGLYTGQTPRYAMAKEATPPRRPPRWERGTEYTPVALQLISRKTPKAVLQRIKESSKLIFSTYQMFSKGVDVPRLAGGVDATPRSASEQTHGRTLRQVPGKPSPIWITILDENNYRSVHQLSARIADYIRNNAVLYNVSSDGDAIPCDAKELRHALQDRAKALSKVRIETPFAGRHTLKSQP